METAARLLRDSELRIWRISDLVGYSGLGVFSKAFHRWSGLRPQHYRMESRIRRMENQKPIQVFDIRLLERAVDGTLEIPEVHRLIHCLCAIYLVDWRELMPEGR